MSKHYVYAEQFGSKICHKYIEDGKHYSEIISEFPIVLYVKGRKTPSSSIGLMGETLNPIHFHRISDAMSFIEENKTTQEIYGQTNLLYQFLNQRYNDDIEFDFKSIRVLFIDIETAYDRINGFPQPSIANQPVLSISCKLLGDGNPFVVFGMKEYTGTGDFTFIKCETEIDLFKKFQQYMIEVDCDILTGWNLENYDVPFLMNRSNNILGEKFTKKFSLYNRVLPFKSATTEGYRIAGLTVLDYLDLYKKYSSGTRESYRLETVAQYELGVGKANYEEYGGLMGLYEKNSNLYYEYNKRDVELVVMLEQKLNYMFLATTIAYIGKIKFSDIYGQVRFWDNHIYNSLQKKGIQIPPTKELPQEDIIGAYVKDPVPALYKWIVTLDLTSLYPSIMMTFNMSPETLRGKAQYTIDDIDKFINSEIDLSWAKDDNVSVIANGATFDNSKHGIFPELVKDMFGKRKAAKKKAMDISKEIENSKDVLTPEQIKAMKSEEATYDARQMAFKIALNSLYGASANRFFRYNSRDIAEGITLTGQLIIRFISKRLNEQLNASFKTKGVDYIIFNDTDSAGINLQHIVDKLFEDQSDIQKIVDFLDKFVKCHIDIFIDNEYKRLVNYLNAYENMISMKREVIADRGLWRGKKNYVLQVWDKEGIRYKQSKLKMMGIETAKSSTPKFVRGSLEKALRIILNGTEKELQSFVKDFRNKFNRAPLADIAFPRGVSNIDKWKDSRGHPIAGTPIHVRGSLLYNLLIKKYDISDTHPAIVSGDKIKFIYLKKENPTHSYVISFFDELPKEFGLDEYIDKKYQFERTYHSPLTSFADIVHWKLEHEATLDMFFTDAGTDSELDR